MASRFKLGRLPATRPAALKDLSVYAAGPLPNPPATREVPGQHNLGGLYPIDGNATYGDCTIAGVSHLLEAWNLETGQKDAIPDETDIVQTYFSLTGGEDTGLEESGVLKTWQTTGLFGNKIAAYAPVNPKDLLELHQAVAFYGGCYLGIECPESAQMQFSNGEPWTYVDGSPIEGGHCVAALGYGPNGGLHCATWGGIAVLEASFLAHFLDEAWVILSEEMVQAKGDALGIDLEALKVDLAKV
jgi:hypothetical protein